MVGEHALADEGVQQVIGGRASETPRSSAASSAVMPDVERLARRTSRIARETDWIWVG